MGVTLRYAQPPQIARERVKPSTWNNAKSFWVILRMDEILHHLTNPGSMIPTYGFPWFQSGAGFRSSTVWGHPETPKRGTLRGQTIWTHGNQAAKGSTNRRNKTREVIVSLSTPLHPPPPDLEPHVAKCSKTTVKQSAISLISHLCRNLRTQPV